ncbi:MAG: Gfo/Idh/MocA family protein [Planctomycetota bacterium]
MAPRTKLRVGVVGVGFMGRTHIEAWRAADAAGRPNELVAVCDRPEVLEAMLSSLPNVDRSRVRRYGRAEELFADPGIDAVSLCTPTPSHVDLALAALAAGKHVLVEKPIAIRSEDAERLSEAALRAGTLCMPAMCVRFWPGWSWLAERIRAGTFGAVRSAVFRRLGTRPSWSNGFYEDYEQSGGALFDLHIHDADFVRWALGAPARVTTGGSLDHATTIYGFPEGPAHVAAEGGWDHAAGFPFTMTYTVVLDGATADYDSNREPKLRLSRDGKTEPVPLEPTTGYDGEIRHFADAVAGQADLAATCGQAAALVRMLEAERRSLESGAPAKTA